jgi:hypothetical protein
MRLFRPPHRELRSLTGVRDRVTLPRVNFVLVLAAAALLGQVQVASDNRDEKIERAVHDTKVLSAQRVKDRQRQVEAICAQKAEIEGILRGLVIAAVEPTGSSDSGGRFEREARKAERALAPEPCP